MAKPVWITKSQNLSTINELEFFEFQLQASDTASYKLIAGELPNGLQISSTGLISGIPVVSEASVPERIYEYSFTVRAIGTQSPWVVDRTFRLSVSNIRLPVIISPPSNLGVYQEGDYIDLQLVALDFTPEVDIKFSLVSGGYALNIIDEVATVTGDPIGFLTSNYIASLGDAVLDQSTGDFWVATLNGWVNNGNNIYNQLPNNLTLTSTGRLFGYLLKSPSTQHIIYNFSVELTDGVNTTRQPFTLRVNLNPASPIPPLLLTEASEMVAVKHDNYYSFKFTGYDFSDPPEQLEYFIVNDQVGLDQSAFDDQPFDLPVLDLTDTLTLDADTGWLYGYLPKVNQSGIFEFTVGVKRVSDQVSSQYRTFRLTVNEFDSIDIQWLTPSDLGTVYNGSISNLSVEAISPFGGNVSYSLLPYNPLDPKPIRLPQGIILTSSGLLSGRFSFRIFSLDNGTTTISDDGITSYGESYSFTVLAQANKLTSFDNATTTWDTGTTTFLDDTGSIVAQNYKTFTVKIINRNIVPYENVYLRALLNQTQRQQLNKLLQSTDWLPDDYVYRNEDLYYGRARELRMLFLPGVNIDTLTSYIDSTEFNHYRKNVYLKDLKLARATDETFNTIYEVIYVEVSEDQKFTNNNSALELDLFNKLTNFYQINGIDQTVIYPNTLRNMRTRMLENLDLESRGVLPRWMTSVQNDGSVPGLTYAIPLAYVKPGIGLIAIQKLQEKINLDFESLGEFNFTIDRYQIDKQLSRYWDFTEQKFLTSELTRFFEGDIIALNKGTVNYAVEVPFETINQASLYDLLGYSSITVISPDVFNVTLVDADSPLNSGWPVWMNDNAVWFNGRLSTLKGIDPLRNTTQIFERDFYVSTPGIYTLTAMNSDAMTITIDDVTVANIGKNNITSDPENWFTTVRLTTGYKTLKATITIDNTGSNFWPDNPKGFAIKIFDGPTEIFDTRTFKNSKVKFNNATGLPGFDGISNIQTGQKLIFARQDSYPGYNLTNNGWNIYASIYGDEYDNTGYNASTVVPGLQEYNTSVIANKPIFTASITGTTLNVTAISNSVAIAVDQTIYAPNIIPGTKIIALGTGSGGIGTYIVDTSQTLTSRAMFSIELDANGNPNVTDNERAGIWSISIDSESVVTLTFDEEMYPGEYVSVKSGLNYGGAKLQLSYSPSIGRSELEYVRLSAGLFNNETIFDGGDTQFIEYRDLYIDPGRGDKYVIYPKLGVFE